MTIPRTMWSAAALLVGVACSAPATNGSEPEGRAQAAATACAHDRCVTGKKLSTACDSCVTAVCDQDSYCCRTSWDSTCVGEVASICHATCGGGSPDAGPPPTGDIGPDGGTESQLAFGVVGDTRPATKDDTSGYPSDVISTIFADVTKRSDSPPFVISTGDYNFSSPTGPESASQFDLYLQARAQYPGAWFPAMGNHECTGYTDSNCGENGADGVTDIYASYLSKLLGPVQKTAPYYVIHVDASDGSWTSKFVFVAANAWDDAQGSWLDAAMAESTTYTFVVRHEAASVRSAPGVSPSEKIISKYPYTLEIVGHSHTYSHSGRELLVGNGGAPLTGSVNYGYALVRRRADGAVAVDMYDYQTNEADASFHFAVHADGSAAAP